MSATGSTVYIVMLCVAYEGDTVLAVMGTREEADAVAARLAVDWASTEVVECLVGAVLEDCEYLLKP